MATILLIDDDASNREPATKLIRSAGYDVIRAANGRDALELLETTVVDCIVLDLIMPEMDGLTFLTILRRNPRFAHLPTVMQSALSDGQAMQRSHRLGVNEYLIKGRSSPEKLIEAIRRSMTYVNDVPAEMGSATA
jgi:CheY-like chemotaxis protein